MAEIGHNRAASDAPFQPTPEPAGPSITPAAEGKSTPDARQKATRKRPYRRSGFYSLERAVKSGRIDLRTRVGRDARQFQADLESDLGGAEGLSASQRVLVENSAMLAALSRLGAAVLAASPGMALQKGASGSISGLSGLVKDWVAVSARLATTLETLAPGLQRKPKDVGSLADYLASRAAIPVEAVDIPPAVLVAKEVAGE